MTAPGRERRPGVGTPGAADLMGCPPAPIVSTAVAVSVNRLRCTLPATRRCATLARGVVARYPDRLDAAVEALGHLAAELRGVAR